MNRWLRRLLPMLALALAFAAPARAQDASSARVPKRPEPGVYVVDLAKMLDDADTQLVQETAARLDADKRMPIAVATAGNLLARVAPAQRGQRNELPDAPRQV
jgi:uncharacterized membrane protein YgcG